MTSSIDMISQDCYLTVSVPLRSVLFFYTCLLSVICPPPQRLQSLVVKPVITTRLSCNFLFIQATLKGKPQEAVQLAPVLEVRVTVSGRPSRSFAVPPHFAASGNLSGNDQCSPMEGMSPPSKHGDDEAGQRTPSLRSLPTEPEGQETYMSGMRATSGRTSSGLARKESVRTTRSTHTTTAFANGAPLTGPNAEPNVDESLFVRGARAERSLSQKQKDRIAKVESEFSNRGLRMALTQYQQERNPGSFRSFS